MAPSIHSKKIKVGGLDIRYFTGGEGEPLLIVHGGSKGASAWMDNVKELAQNYTVYIPDLPGFGQSQPLGGDCYIPELTDFLDSFSREVGLDSFHLMGHSLGGGIALNYALKFPQKITKLVLVSSLCIGKEIALWVRCLANPRVIRYVGKATLAILRAVKWLAEALVLAPL